MYWENRYQQQWEMAHTFCMQFNYIEKKKSINLYVAPIKYVPCGVDMSIVTKDCETMITIGPH